MDFSLTSLNQGGKGPRCQCSEQDQDVVRTTGPHHVEAGEASSDHKNAGKGVEGTRYYERMMSSSINRQRRHWQRSNWLYKTRRESDRQVLKVTLSHEIVVDRASKNRDALLR